MNLQKKPKRDAHFVNKSSPWVVRGTSVNAVHAAIKAGTLSFYTWTSFGPDSSSRVVMILLINNVVKKDN